jgi:hypothetical protein
MPPFGVVAILIPRKCFNSTRSFISNSLASLSLDVGNISSVFPGHQEVINSESDVDAEFMMDIEGRVPFQSSEANF